MTSMDDLIALIGKPTEHPEVKAFLKGRKWEKWHSKPKDPKRYLCNHADGYDLCHTKGKKGIIITAWIFLTEEDEYQPFRGALSRGLFPEHLQSDVQRIWGNPTRSGCSHEESQTHWDRYDSESVCIHITYQDGCGPLRLITIMSPETAP